MKNFLSVLVFFVLCVSEINAQTTSFSTIDSININNINAAVLVHGDMWWNPTTQQNHCQFPASSATNIGFTSSLWMSGYDAGGNLHISAQTYRQNGNDYWPGPLNNVDSTTYDGCAAWAKIWKVNRSEINYFLSLTTHDSASTPSSILTWPGNGNIYAAGAGGASLVSTMVPGYYYAPFIDLNGNGIYEPLLGEYPDVPGDQALWWVFNDNGPMHNETNGLPLGVDVQAMAWAYSRGTLIDNVVYYHYRIINHSANYYSNFRIGEFADMDLGFFDDDFIGYDSIHRMGITYNGDNDDTVTSYYTGLISPASTYGREIPVAGVTLIQAMGDNPGTSYVPAGCFNYYNIDTTSVLGNPSVDTQYNNYLRSKHRDGTYIANDFSGPGVPTSGAGAGPATDFVFPGDPSNSSQWSECVSGNIPGDRRFILTTRDTTLMPGAIWDITIALVTTNPDTLNGCPTAGFAGLSTVADTAWADYFNPPAALTTSVVTLLANNTLKLFPDPAHDMVNLSGLNATDNYLINVYNTIGQLVGITTCNKSNTVSIPVSNLPSGMYYVMVSGAIRQQKAKFIKY